MANYAGSTIRDRLKLPTSTELHDKIRRLWIDHSIAEDKRDLDGLIATLSPDCVYEVVPTGEKWVGHEGARNFYTSFLGAFPDVHFDLQDIVIGPQGVFEVALMTGTQKGEWVGLPATGKFISVIISIYFPWDADTQKFAGEKVYYDRVAMAGG